MENKRLKYVQKIFLILSYVYTLIFGLSTSFLVYATLYF